MTAKKPNAAPAAPAANTIEQLNDSLDALISRRMQAAHRAHQLETEAKKHHANGKMDLARAALKRKATYTHQMAQLDGQIAKMEQTTIAVESTAATVDVAQSMKAGSVALQTMLKQTSIVDIETVADDLEDNMIQAGELGEALSRPFGGMGTTVEDEDLDAEMSGWNVGNNGRPIMDIPSPPSTPIQNNPMEGTISHAPSNTPIAPKQWIKTTITSSK